MKPLMRKLAAIAPVFLAFGVLGACANTTQDDETIGGDVIAPVTMSVVDLNGVNVDLRVGQALNIDTGDVDGSEYNGLIADPVIAEFVPGSEDSTASFNPGVLGLSEGATEVVLSDGVDETTFVVTVVSSDG